MITGSCHCETVKWTYSLPLESVTACNCKLCRRYGALWAYGHLDQGIQISGSTSVYMRDRKLNGFYFCPRCGCLAYYLSNSEDEQGRRRMAVNLRMIHDPNQIAHLPIDHFDGLDKFEDLPRNGRRVQDLWF